MAQECLDGDFRPDDDHPDYTAQKHLWNCQGMATAGAFTAMGEDPGALAAAARIAETPCTHTDSGQ